MVEIYKKIWPKYFKMVKSRKKNCELRLADFRIRPGDWLVLEEWDPEKKEYTGRKLRKKVKRVTKINLFDFYKIKDLKKYGCYLIEF
jgi:ASC-1-like (ASCH) protein